MLKLWMRTSVAVVAVTLVALLHLVGCKGSTSTKDFVEIRIVHTSTDLGAVDVYASNGTLLFAGLAYNGVTGSAVLPPGTYNLLFRDADSAATSAPVLTSVPITLTMGQERVTSVIAGLRSSASTADSLRLLVFVDNFDPNEFPLARVRFINACADAPELAIDTDDNGDAELEGLERFGATAAAGSNLPVLELNIAFLTGDPLLKIDGYQFTDLNRSDQFLIITTGLLSEARTSPNSFRVLVVGLNGLVATVQPNPDIYFLNASTDTSPLSLRLNGQVVFNTANYGALSGPAQTLPGLYNLNVSGSSPFSTSTETLEEGGTYIIVAAGVAGPVGETAQIITIRDEFEFDALTARLRFAHFAPDLPSVNYGIVTTPPTFDIPILFEETPFGESSVEGGEPLPPGGLVFGAAAPGGTSATQTFTVPTTANMRSFIFLIGLLNGGFRAPQTFQILTGVDPWVAMTIDAD